MKSQKHQHLYGETVSWSLATASTAQLAIGRGSTPLGDTSFFIFGLAVFAVTPAVRWWQVLSNPKNCSAACDENDLA